MRIFYLLPLFLPILNLPLVSCTKEVGKQKSYVKLETDDDYRPAFDKLVDVSGKINAYVSSIALQQWQKLAPKGAQEIPTEKITHALYQELSKARKGSGFEIWVGISRVEVSAYTEIEAWLVENLDEAKGEKITIKFRDSRYRNNPVGLSGVLSGVWPRKPSQLVEWTANHSIAPVIKIGQSFIGIDKMGHFFEQGYWYYKTLTSDCNEPKRPLNAKERYQFGQYMEGDDDLAESIRPKYQKIFAQWCWSCASFGYYGSKSTGVVSFADMNANEMGAKFYQEFSTLLQNEKSLKSWSFNFQNYSPEIMNEQAVPNKYVGIDVVRP